MGEDTTEKEANQSAAKALVDRLLEGLKPDDRMIITMLDLEQKSVKEIAKLTDFTESNVKVRAHRARDKMKKILATLTPEKYL